MNNQYSSTTLTINLQAIRENYRILKGMVGGGIIAPAVKANAYGLGIKKIAPVLENEGCNMFFVANLDEALELRELLPNVTIFVLHGIVLDQEDIFTAYNITPVLNSTYQINIWQQHAIKKQEILDCILHFDTGMNRLGIRGIIDVNINPLYINPLYIMSHLACADDKMHPKNNAQLLEFQSIAKNFTGKKLSLANSGGIFLGKNYHLDMVRPGIAIYGCNPLNNLPNPMKNVINLTSKILQIERVDRAVTVGYGALRKVERGTKIATIAVGYADGYLRCLGDRGICAIGGVFVPVIGRISMDLITLDVTEIADAKLSEIEEIELIGDNIPVDVGSQI
jgi:alanine racemase